ncbi:cell wall binding repeat-containing protein [Clostridium sp. DL-VIII]|uniref:immunoglobulin-like domain-containing protein n=1 Tax=Clostridium sp. DL-VIII TaxID=641107 RepID=UPI00023B011D|nr:immunoglobulin-like domain-containing protein [Clostridium sp. DL-VIII]EHJ00460.1 cell wall binding repeat-containing protein [Clostridium sp. DL-VIII]
MKKIKLTKVIASSLAVASMLTMYPIKANAEWKQDSNGWWNTEGSSWSVGWKEIDGKWYYFRQDGYMAHDTVIDGYELGSDGAWIQAASNSKNVAANENQNFDINEFKNTLKTEGYPVEVRDTLYKENLASKGWKLVNGKYYYFSFEGALAKDKIVDGYYLGADGALDTTKGKSQLQDITMKTEKSVYPLGTEKIRVNITNNTNLECEYGGMYYQIDKFENNEWHDLEFEESAAFTDVAAILPAKGINMGVCELNILKNFKNLTAGKYRVLVEIENSIGYSHVTAEFELQ